jgi:hypothetical protein
MKGLKNGSIEGFISSLAHGCPMLEYETLYNLYCVIAFAFKGDELWSFCGLLQFDHEQIHIKWVTNYNMDHIEHQAFLLNNKKT